MSSLKIEKLVTKRNIEGNQEILTLSKPVTNKACAYIINRPLVELLLDAVSDPANEAVRSLAIDWLTNALFMQIGGLGSQITCQLFDPPLLIQGSMLSTYESWHPDRTYRP